MRFKLDENLDVRAAGILVSSGHDVLTVNEQELQGASDFHIADICRKENRCLITLDKHFSNPFSYPPNRFRGIIVLRPKKAEFPIVLKLMQEVAIQLNQFEVDHCLWIVEPGRIRIHR
jgi:predicted nuclease of predicted toxin-antitoxin system